MIISTRESQACRGKGDRSGHLPDQRRFQNKCRRLRGTELPEECSEQFDVSDTRTLDQVVSWLIDGGYIPSFCTACYREGRTGDRFMSLCKSGQISNCCLPNALMTLQEYLIDYASPETRAKGEKLIREQLANILREKVREIVEKNLVNIENGQRDFRF